MSLAENDAWKNSTPNCFTRCAGTVIMNPSASWGKVWPAGRNAQSLYSKVKPLSIFAFLNLSPIWHSPPVGWAGRLTHKMWATSGWIMPAPEAHGHTTGSGRDFAERRGGALAWAYGRAVVN